MTESLFPDRRTAREMLELQRRQTEAVEALVVIAAQAVEVLSGVFAAQQPPPPPPPPADGLDSEEGEDQLWRIDIWNEKRGVKVGAYAATEPSPEGKVFTVGGVEHVTTRVTTDEGRKLQRVWVVPVGKEEETKE